MIHTARTRTKITSKEDDGERIRIAHKNRIITGKKYVQNINCIRADTKRYVFEWLNGIGKNRKMLKSIKYHWRRCHLLVVVSLCHRKPIDIQKKSDKNTLY